MDFCQINKDVFFSGFKYKMSEKASIAIIHSQNKVNIIHQ